MVPPEITWTSTVSTDQEKRTVKCSLCHYALTEEEKVLCKVGGRCYCPKCWRPIMPHIVRENGTENHIGK
jgi:hypothetical protein